MTTAMSDVSTQLMQKQSVQALLTPAQLKQQQMLSAALAVQVEQQRNAIRQALAGEDERLLVIVGPCSVHDEQAALDYGQRLAQLNTELKDKLHIVMRAYVEKPRTTVGWKGLAYDPLRDGVGNMALGLERSRQLMLALVKLGLPIASEALNPLVMNYLDDVVSWVAIGARTAESQPHREMVSHLPMPVGIKNSTDGCAVNAINAMQSAKQSHHTLGINAQGQVAMLTTPGNPDTHLVLRGGHHLTNYDEVSIHAAQAELLKAGCSNKVLVDCSHANSEKQFQRQYEIALNVAKQRTTNKGILGIMLESFIAEGRQDDGQNLHYGCSITDACLGWETTANLLRELHALS